MGSLPHSETIVTEEEYQVAYSLWISNEKCLLIISIKRGQGVWVKRKTIELPRYKASTKPEETLTETQGENMLETCVL